MNVETLCDAVKGCIEKLRLSECKYEGHVWVEVFQKNLAEILNGSSTGYTWDIENEHTGRSEGDRIDVYGFARNLPSWIIEIDATRADQVAKKILSRLALWGLKDPINYVAIMYPNTQKGKNECEKYLRYGSDILHKINSRSRIIGIFIDPADGSIEVLDFSESSHFEVEGEECRSMSYAAAAAISVYMSRHPVKYDRLKELWEKYVSDERGASRYKNIGKTTVDGTDVFTYTQFRQYGTCAYWDDFVKKCKKNGISLIKMRKLYVGEKQVYKYIPEKGK